MASDTGADEAERAEHEAFAKQANRETWTLLERDDRTAVDDESMIRAAHASAFHWSMAGGPAESARADWLLSHVYAVLGRPEPAKRYAQQCLATCEREGLVDFDLAYAYEAMARSAASAHHPAEAAQWRAKSEHAATAIADPEDRELFVADLAAGPWYDEVSS